MVIVVMTSLILLYQLSSDARLSAPQHSIAAQTLAEIDYLATNVGKIFPAVEFLRYSSHVPHLSVFHDWVRSADPSYSLIYFRRGSHDTTGIAFCVTNDVSEKGDEIMEPIIAARTSGAGPANELSQQS